jgi:hypothetical protein
VNTGMSLSAFALIENNMRIGQAIRGIRKVIK